MTQVKRILAPTDLSQLSLTGLRYAFNLAQSFNAKVTVYHIINRDELMHFSEQLQRFGNPTAMGRHTENLLEESQAALSHFLQDNLGDLLPAVKFQTKVEMGLPYKNIVERARDDGSDLIVMSTHGRTGFSHVLLGSVTEKVVRTAPCPVVSIHPEEERGSSEGKTVVG
jgi:nucleotide-binding universal stress UspA family protein